MKVNFRKGVREDSTERRHVQPHPGGLDGWNKYLEMRLGRALQAESCSTRGLGWKLSKSDMSKASVRVTWVGS